LPSIKVSSKIQTSNDVNDREFTPSVLGLLIIYISLDKLAGYLTR